MGQHLREHRRAAKLSLRELGRRAALSAAQLCRIEAGARRTRRSTLERVARSLERDLEGAHALVCVLTRRAGTSLAAESPYAQVLTQRRERRRNPR